MTGTARVVVVASVFASCTPEPVTPYIQSQSMDTYSWDFGDDAGRLDGGCAGLHCDPDTSETTARVRFEEDLPLLCRLLTRPRGAEPLPCTGDWDAYRGSYIRAYQRAWESGRSSAGCDDPSDSGLPP